MAGLSRTLPTNQSAPGLVSGRIARLLLTNVFRTAISPYRSLAAVCDASPGLLLLAMSGGWATAPDPSHIRSTSERQRQQAG